jgi:hypothetical protein
MQDLLNIEQFDQRQLNKIKTNVSGKLGFVLDIV